MKIFKVLILAIVFAPLIVDAKSNDDWILGIKGGVLLPGSVYVGDPVDTEFDTDSGIVFGLKADTKVAEKMSMGAFYQYSSFSILDGEDVDVNTIGLTIKGKFENKSNIEIRPGLALGYQTCDSDALNDSTSGFDLGAFVEFAYPLLNKNKGAMTGEIGFITQPAGGNSDVDVTFGPIFYLAIGYEF